MGCGSSSERNSSSAPNDGSTPGPRAVAASAHSRNPTSLPNAPLRSPRPWRCSSGSHRWTRSALRRERAIFFETQVTGRAEVWQAVQLAVELVREQGDLLAAQGVLDAAGITMPRGRLEDGVYDERGTFYPLPEWVVSDPTNVEEDVIAAAGDGQQGRLGIVDDDDDEEDDLDAKENMGGEGANKGKGRDASDEATIHVRARLSDRGTDIMVTLGSDQKVKVLEKMIREQANIPVKTRLRLAYLGRMLKENEPLVKQGWQTGDTVSVLVSQ